MSRTTDRETMSQTDPNSTAARIRVLYVVGSGRSGSTIITNILDQYSGVVSPGELYYLWDRGLIANERCGCGKPLQSCELWHQIIEEALGTETDPLTMVRRRNITVRTRHIFNVLFGRKSQARHEFLDSVASVYRALADRTNATLIVDSSKVPVYGLALAKDPAFAVRFLHLVRDPRAVAYSWQRRKDRLVGEEPAFITQHSPYKSAMMWFGWNGIAQLLWGRSDKYLRLRYEDFTESPRETISLILRHAGITDTDPSAFTDATTVRLEPSHTVSGNPSRFATGSISIRRDDEWTVKLAWKSRVITVALTWPLLLWYRY